MTSLGDSEPGLPRPESVGARIHPLVPPLGLAVITLVGAAIVIGFGHPGDKAKTTTTTTTTKHPPVVFRYRGGKLPPRKHETKPKPPKPAAVPRWLARELGPRSPAAPLVHVVSRDLRIAITRRGFKIVYRNARLSRYATGLGRVGPLVRYRHGALRRLSFGADATVVRGSVTSSYILVGRRFGSRTWTWHVDTNLRPRIRKDGALLLSGRDSFLVQPPRILDRTGKDLTPRALRWRLQREAAGYRVSLSLADRRLPLPYVIAG